MKVSCRRQRHAAASRPTKTETSWQETPPLIGSRAETLEDEDEEENEGENERENERENGENKNEGNERTPG